MNFIDVNSVVKQYDGHLALDHVDLHVPQGCIYGLLGPNGAGKTSLIRIINRITRADSGTVLINGRAMEQKDIANIGYLPEERGLYKKLKVGDEIMYLARLKGMPKVLAESEMKKWLERFDLTEWRNRKVEELSKGMQQKVQFITTVIHRPQLLIFDEPFSGFDPVNAEQLKREIIQLRNEGSTILFSTHNMASVEEICEQITLINHSRVVLEGHVADIKQQHKKNLFVVNVAGDKAIEAREGLFEVVPSDEHQGTLIKLSAGVTLRDAISYLNEHYTLTGINEKLPSMNEIFIETVQN
ncbi:MAG: ATP-binding cassette domain-containing protein [Muribaculaceae bacterium]|nr:ATP-binding cassette domain-containing protein [Muribaculaceae bacterium]MBR6490060.1 ATP-binding cassette domain-containing protein [Muribaculaceae bacterium]